MPTACQHKPSQRLDSNKRDRTMSTKTRQRGREVSDWAMLLGSGHARRVVLSVARVMPPAVSIVTGLRGHLANPCPTTSPSCGGVGLPGQQVIVLGVKQMLHCLHASTLCMRELAKYNHTCAQTPMHAHIHAQAETNARDVNMGHKRLM